ncbi:MAG: NAD(+) synthase [Candidatus Levybacteria bacterium]|nr:NAD(+) synthase [Candidatus Levybacteria bacterium]
MKQFNNNLLNINPSAETKKIVSFIKTVLQKQNFKNVVIGVSGGIDSAVSLSLLAKSIPPQNIFVAHLYYFKSQIGLIKQMFKKANIPQKNIYNISIKDAVDSFRNLHLFQVEQVRLGNIMARVRMIILYDIAKKHNGLVCGTENKSEKLLGYFTRFGDEASDFEPIQHLYKTQVYELAKYLSIPQSIIDLPPTAGLWIGQTDEGDFGFSYKEADNVLYLYNERKNSLSEIISKGFPNAKKIIDWALKNSFKHHLPYMIK